VEKEKITIDVHCVCIIVNPRRKRGREEGEKKKNVSPSPMKREAFSIFCTKGGRVIDVGLFVLVEFLLHGDKYGFTCQLPISLLGVNWVSEITFK